MGHAYEWDDRGVGRVPVDGNPAVGAIAQWERNTPYTPSGHVAYVEDVTATSIEITEDNWGGGTRRVVIARGSSAWPSHFIHIKDVQLPSAAVVARVGVTTWAKYGLNDNWTRIADFGGSPRVTGRRITVLDAARTLWGKDGINGTWYRLADNITSYAASPNVVVVRLGTKMWAKAGLNDTWTRIADFGGTPSVSGNRITMLDGARTLWGKDGINGTWYRLADNVTSYAASASTVAIRLGATIWAKAGLNDTWTRIADLGATPRVSGNRITMLDSARTLWAKDGINGTWYRLADEVTSYAASSTTVVARLGSTIWAKAGLNDTWTRLADIAATPRVTGSRITMLDTNATLWGKDGINGIWYRLADSVVAYGP